MLIRIFDISQIETRKGLTFTSVYFDTAIRYSKRVVKFHLWLCNQATAMHLYIIGYIYELTSDVVDRL